MFNLFMGSRFVRPAEPAYQGTMPFLSENVPVGPSLGSSAKRIVAFRMYREYEEDFAFAIPSIYPPLRYAWKRTIILLAFFMP